MFSTMELGRRISLSVAKILCRRYLRGMTPEELAYLNKLSEDILEIKLMFERFTAEKQQRWKDEQVRRRERSW
jgi:hypothetical protein